MTEITLKLHFIEVLFTISSHLLPPLLFPCKPCIISTLVRLTYPRLDKMSPANSIVDNIVVVFVVAVRVVVAAAAAFAVL